MPNEATRFCATKDSLPGVKFHRENLVAEPGVPLSPEILDLSQLRHRGDYVLRCKQSKMDRPLPRAMIIAASPPNFAIEQRTARSTLSRLDPDAFARHATFTHGESEHCR